MRSTTKWLIFMVGMSLALIFSTNCSAQRRIVGPFSNAGQYSNMPITARPNRIGHFYGNAVRRRYDRQQNMNFRGPAITPVFTPNESRLPLNSFTPVVPSLLW